jgi:hypothetical protein
MKRRSLFTVCAIFVGAGMVTMGACTVFDGVTLPAQDGSLDETIAEAASDASPPDAGAGYLSLDDAVRFCANAFKCPYLPSSVIYSLGVPVESLHFSACVNWLAGPIPQDRPGIALQAQWLQCAAKATTCQQAGSCMWWEIIDPKDSRCAGNDAGQGGSCNEDGGAAYYCASGVIAHCTHPAYPPGATCLVGTNNDHRCATDKPPCTKADTCMGSFQRYCASSGVYEGYDCAILGYTCGLDPMSGYIQCLSDGVYKTCNAPAVTCDQSGNWVNVCDSTQIGTFKCSSLGGTCDPSGATPRCKLPGEKCNPYDKAFDQCTGNSISLCVGGQPTTFDCAKVGLTCKPASGPTSAHCG